MPIETEDIEKELAEAGCLRDSTAEDLEVTLWELTGEIGEMARKIDANLKESGEAGGTRGRGTESTWKDQKSGKHSKFNLKTLKLLQYQQ